MVQPASDTAVTLPRGRHANLQVLAWTCLGLLGSVLMLLVGSQLAGGSFRWWIDPSLSISDSTAEIVLYVGMAALTAAWLGLRTHARTGLMQPATLWAIAAVWCLPLLLCAPVFSRDVYSYFAQGAILNLGHNPYHDLPTILGQLHQPRVLDGVDPFWQHTTAPYGPFFLEIVSGIFGVAGPHPVLGAQLVKLLGLFGLVLLGVFVPRLARAQGHDPTRATWLAILNPLVLFALVVPGHNDLLMIGLLAAGVAVAAEGRPLWGIGICALAATIKLPAAAGALFIAITWARAGSGPREQISRLAQSAALTLAILALVSVVTGVGVNWVTSTLFSAPARVHLAITPASGLAWSLYSVLGDLGVHASFNTLQSVLRGVIGAVTLVLVLELLRRARTATLARYLGLALVALAWGGPAAWPWYFTWGLVLLAAAPGPWTHTWSMGLMIVGAFAVKPDGILAFPLQSAPWVMGFYALIALISVYMWRRRPALATGRRPGPPLTEPAAGPDEPETTQEPPSALVKR